MSLVKFDAAPTESTWTNRDKKAVRHKIPGAVQKPVIDYDRLKQLCAIEGLHTVKSKTTDDAHKRFMESYTRIFVEDEKLSGHPIHSLNRSLKKLSESRISTVSTSEDDTESQSVAVGNTDEKEVAPTTKENPTNAMSHDIRDYMSKLHRQRQSEDPEAIKRDRIRLLRRLLKKLPFERTAQENDQIYNAIKHFEVVAGQFSANVLTELCVVAQLDVWKEPDLTIFGNTGFHFILKGIVKPVTDPWVKFRGEKIEFRSPTPEPEPGTHVPQLSIGDVFGTLEKIECREPNTRILSVTTTSEVTEFLRISCNDYKRVIEQIRQRDETEKVNLLQSCKAYQYWSKQPLVKVANLLEWASFPANTVLVSEGYNSPFIAIIKSGVCHVLRHVDVLKKLPNGAQEKRTKQVVMGKLGVHDSFGEISVITEKPITCSIVTSEAVELAVIEPEKLKELDDTTVQLLQQSSEETFGKLTMTDIHNEYVSQELKREWNEFKHGVVNDVINSRGIRPGYGKWAKN